MTFFLQCHDILLTEGNLVEVRNLLKLGTYKREAILTSLSRKGPWHCARTMATQAGMTNKWLAEKGLISIKEQWSKIHYPATAR